MPQSVEAQAIEDVESTGSVPSPEATATKETPASGSRMMRTRSVSPKPRYTSLGMLQSGLSKREPRVKTSEPIQEETSTSTASGVGGNHTFNAASATDIRDGFTSTDCRYCNVQKTDRSRG